MLSDDNLHDWVLSDENLHDWVQSDDTSSPTVLSNSCHMLSCSLSMCLSACACLHVLVTPAEFARTVVNYLDDGEDEELRLRNAWVYHTIFENGTSLRQHEQEGLHAVGIRMLYHS